MGFVSASFATDVAGETAEARNTAANRETRVKSADGPNTKEPGVLLCSRLEKERIKKGERKRIQGEGLSADRAQPFRLSRTGATLCAPSTPYGVTKLHNTRRICKTLRCAANSAYIPAANRKNSFESAHTL